MRYIFFTTGARPWFDLASRLHDSGLATPVLWIGDHTHRAAASEKFGADTVQTMDDFVHYPWRLNNIGYSAQNHEFFSSMEYYRAKDRALKMMDRLDIYGTFSRLDREAYFKNVCIWGLNRISELNPDALIVTEAPHSHAQYALFEICRFLKIRTFKLAPWTIVPVLSLRSFDGDEIFAPDRDRESGVHQRIREGVEHYVEQVLSASQSVRYDPNYMQRQRRASTLWGRLSTIFTRSLWHRWISRVYHRLRLSLRGEYAPLSPSSANLLLSFLTVGAKRRHLRKNSSGNHHAMPDLNREFVYFGLHYEPERTTNPDGGEYHDQVLALIRLRSILPEDIHIYVKEHPSQFLTAMKGAQGRSPLTYANIENIANVSMVRPDTPSLELTLKSVMVATITGTLALEAAILGKKALVFGDAWYEGMPNVTTWHDALTYDDIASNPLRESEEVKQFLLDECLENKIVGCQNNSFEAHFNTYVNNEFREVEFDELFSAFSKLSRSIGARSERGGTAGQGVRGKPK